MLTRNIRPPLRELLEQLNEDGGIIFITGPRQCGKTVLVKNILELFSFSEMKFSYFSLSDPAILEKAVINPPKFIRSLKGLVVLDDLHFFPELIGMIAEYSISLRRSVIEKSSSSDQEKSGLILICHDKSLAPPDIDMVIMHYLSIYERSARSRKPTSPEQYIIGSTFPSRSNKPYDPRWCQKHVEELIMDITNRYQIRQLENFRKFIKTVATYIGKAVNLTDMASCIGVSRTTISTWLKILEDNFIIYLLHPHQDGFSRNGYKRRTVKTPRLYFHEPALAAFLLGIQDFESQATIQLKAALFENFIILEYLKWMLNRIAEPGLYYWRDNTGNEVPLVIELADRLFPVLILYQRKLSRRDLDFVERWRKLCGFWWGTGVYAGDNSYMDRCRRLHAWQKPVAVELVDVPKFHRKNFNLLPVKHKV
ncbi:ATP-binding protein [Flavihumibacter sp.]|uniref:ATP-binding protein n=1 Tax=Flavihumibacter sp. TaxID=1913981 RepID=UPI002FC8DB20